MGPRRRCPRSPDRPPAVVGFSTVRSDPPGCLFMGSGAFAVPTLEALSRSPDIRLIGIVTAPPRAAGRHGTVRPTPVARSAASVAPHAPVLTPTRLRDEAAHA